ncbi:hypothetical protein CEXT_364371 [Caerostris extrusa]|uniref:Uncharacterized protein n=1 Tax=Caerostris extrusa TaxID=172846 RepID=A0AAV4M5W0_CAEEX|nr:hypothetical protein CEXT_364371 [Caerostris extrusa]
MFALPTVPQMIRTSNTSTSTSRLFHVVWPGARLTAKIRSELALFRLDELISSAVISTESKMKFLMINKKQLRARRSVPFMLLAPKHGQRPDDQLASTWSLVPQLQAQILTVA